MKDFEGTKGEWLIDGNTLYSLHEINFGNRKVHTNRFSAGIYADQNCPEAIEELKHNIRLMRAAPELLSVIQKALNISDLWCFPDDASEEYRNEAIVLNEMKRDFEKAINKALGE